MKNNFFRRIIFAKILLIFFIKGFGQSSFSYEVLSKNCNIGILSYVDRIKSIAETDTVAIPQFSYLSIGRIKKLSAVSKGCVFAIIEYKGGQSIVFEATYHRKPSVSEIKVAKWLNNLDTEFSCSLLEEITPKDSRYSITKIFNNEMRVHLINIKEQNLDLFKYMLSTLDTSFADP